MSISRRSLFFALLLAGAAVGVSHAAQGEAWVIRNARIVPVSGPILERGSILIRDGLIQEVGETVSAPEGAREVDGAGLTAYPGLIDLHTTLGQPENLPAGSGPPAVNQPMATALNHLKPIPAGMSPGWRVASVLRPGTDLERARNSGVTLALSTPRSGVVPGSGALIRTAGEKGADLPVPGVNPVYFQYTGTRGAYPATLMGTIAVQRQALADAAS